MGLAYAFKQLFSGNVQDAFNGIWVSDDLLAAQDAAGNNLQKIIARQQADGLVDAQQAQDMYSELAPNSNSDAYWKTAGATPWMEFETSLEENASKIGQFGAGAINKTLGIGFRIIPWQVWIALFALLLIWLYPIWRPFAATFLSRSK